MSTVTAPHGDVLRVMLNKVPEVTIAFWVIKVLATTVGETAADFLAVTLGLGLSGTTVIMGALTVAALVAQFRARRYRPALYWVAVVLISIVGTLVTDGLVDGLGVSLWVTTLGFALALTVTFSTWWAVERTLSIHTIQTTRRESFYWAAILFTFALGTAAGDLLSEGLALGYAVALAVFAAAIALVALAYNRRLLAAIPAFWAAYVLTRPLGASVGDLLSQAPADGGLGLGTVATSGVFLLVILALVTHLSRQQRTRHPVDAA